MKNREIFCTSTLYFVTFFKPIAFPHETVRVVTVTFKYMLSLNDIQYYSVQGVIDKNSG